MFGFKLDENAIFKQVLDTAQTRISAEPVKADLALMLEALEPESRAYPVEVAAPQLALTVMAVLRIAEQRGISIADEIFKLRAK